jgi:hypothetical protein
LPSKSRYIGADGQFDPDLGRRSTVFVVLSEPFPQATGFLPDHGIQPGVPIGRAIEYLHAQDVFLQKGGFAAKSGLNQISQETGRPVALAKRFTGDHLAERR